MLNKNEFIKICFEDFSDDERKLLEIFLNAMSSSSDLETDKMFKSIIDAYVDYIKNESKGD